MRKEERVLKREEGEGRRQGKPNYTSRGESSDAGTNTDTASEESDDERMEYVSESDVQSLSSSQTSVRATPPEVYEEAGGASPKQLRVEIERLRERVRGMLAKTGENEVSS